MNIGTFCVGPTEKRFSLGEQPTLTFHLSIDAELQATLLRSQDLYGNVDEIGMQGIIAAWIQSMVSESSCGEETVTAMATKPARKIRRVK
jgi:hypothetical protein